MTLIGRDRWQQLEPLVDRALELPDAERAEWLSNLRLESPAIADELDALLAGETLADRRGFLTEPLEVDAGPLAFGAYVLERPLGDGGMGSVWLAHRADDPTQHAAVKLLNLTGLGSINEERFRREGMLLARLDHPGIARFLDAGVGPAGQPFLVLEYVEGEPIDAYVRERQLPVEARVRLVIPTLAAVAHAHAHQIVHRDLKPSNIFVRHDGVVKLLDFGIAKLLDDGRQHALTALTIRGGTLLTPDFAAPEQILGDLVSPATDIYALGVLLYTLITERHPTGAGSRNPGAMMQAVLETEPPPVGIAGLDRIVRRALRKKPEERHQSAPELAGELMQYLGAGSA